MELYKDNLPLHKLYIYEDFCPTQFIETIALELDRYHFSSRYYIDEYSPNMKLIFVRFPGEKVDICDNFPYIDPSDNVATRESLLKSLEEKLKKNIKICSSINIVAYNLIDITHSIETLIDTSNGAAYTCISKVLLY